MSETVARAGRTLRVWDPLVRIGHWLLLLSLLFAWITRHRPGPWHEWIGYAALAIVTVRVVWGWVGAPYARFGEFVRGPRATFDYVRALLGGVGGLVIAYWARALLWAMRPPFMQENFIDLRSSRNGRRNDHDAGNLQI